MYPRGTVLEIVNAGALRKGTYVTVQREYTVKDRETNRPIECSNGERVWSVKPADVRSVVDRSGVLHPKGALRVVLHKGGRFSAGHLVLVERDYTMADLESGRDVRVTDPEAKDATKVEHVTPWHLGYPN